MNAQHSLARGGFRSDLVPRWARIAAWTIPVLCLPSVIWRLAMSIDALISGDNPCIGPGMTPVAELVYVTAILPTVQLGLALLSLGLVKRWGVVVPRRLPILGGRRVPIWLGVGAAVAGAFGIVAFVFLSQVIGGSQPTREIPPGCELPGTDVMVLYLPMALWPPLLIALAVQYLRRRRAEAS